LLLLLLLLLLQLQQQHQQQQKKILPPREERWQGRGNKPTFLLTVQHGQSGDYHNHT